MRKSRVYLLLLPLAVPGLFAQTPSVTANGVLNSATFATSGQPGFAVAPGSLVSIFGGELAAGLSQASSVPLSTTLADVSVKFNDTPAPLLFVSAGQINAQLPWNALPQGTDTGTATVVVTRAGVSSQPQTVQLARFSPGIYTLNSSGTGPAVAVNNSDGSVAQPAGSIPGLNTRPAHIGEAIIVYASGLGPVDSPVNDGAPGGTTLRTTTTEPTVQIGGSNAQVLFSGLTPQFPGVYQLNLTIPAGVQPGGAVPIQVQIGGITTSDRITIAVQP